MPDLSKDEARDLLKRANEQAIHFAEQAAHEPIEETYLGSAEEPETPLPDPRADEIERRLKAIEERNVQLVRDNAELTAKLAKKHAGLNELVQESSEMLAYRARYAFYDRIRKDQDAYEPFATGVVIQLMSHEEPARNFPVPVSVNGRLWKLPRGEPLVVPVEVIEVLDNARVNTVIKEIDDNGNPHIVKRDYLSYPYTILDIGRQAA